MQTSESNPHIRDKFSPLETLIFQALRRYGEYAPGSVDGETILMMIEFANLVVEDVRRHPYWDGTELDYYESQHDVRPIPDPIVVAGLIAHLAIQQSSQKSQIALPLYYRLLNQTLHSRNIGNDKQPVMKLPDKTQNGYK